MSKTDNSKKETFDNKHLTLSPDYAVALQYDIDKHNAPIVVAKGQGDIAKKIIEIAEEKRIEIRQDADLIQILKAVDIDEEIPTEAFLAVSEIISFIYKMNGKLKNAE
ncbi:MAG: EscU/YscU/HrcU family type III secretion system export apparatus switch protein [Alphaproteobacteria bacterium]|nr:EscU/YscU/HrcU family type III secretion system export apparatus switch protein [Alphaproteobacteria bacterium]